MSECPPSPGRNLLSSSSHFSFLFIFLCLVLSVSTTSAQTRQKRTNVKSEERVRRVENEDLPDEDQSDEPVTPKQVPSNPQVRKTALTYTPRPANQATEQRPALTNDIVIISRAPEAAASRSPLAPRAGAAAAANIPSIWPAVGPLRSGVGVRSNPFGGGNLEYHKGQDISVPTGTPVSATADGVVVIARWVKGYGNGIYIDHGNGIMTRYGHLSRIDVVEGQAVKKGQQLGLSGSTGRSTGPHLHYEVRINGVPVSPLPYLPALTPAPSTQAGGQ
jgi:murein DD-endopeptidase MepM/ murein hydrolase activator NlpD